VDHAKTAGPDAVENLQFGVRSQRDRPRRTGLAGTGDDQPLVVQTGGTIAPGGTVTVGEIYVVSGSAGRIAVEADNGSGEYVTVLGVGVSSSRIDLSINASGVAVP